MNYPEVTIGVINSREDYFKQCVSSTKRQIYPNKIHHIFFPNIDKKYTIGQGFNALADKCETEFILFVGDDDFLGRTYLFNLMGS